MIRVPLRARFAMWAISWLSDWAAMWPYEAEEPYDMQDIDDATREAYEQGRADEAYEQSRGHKPW